MCLKAHTRLQNITSVLRDARLHRAGSRNSSSNVLALEISQETSGGVAHSTAGSKDIGLARTSKTSRASGARGGREHLALKGGSLHLDGDVLEDAALDEDVGSGADLEGVAGGGVVVPVVVDGVEQSVSADLGGTAAHVVDVVVLEGNHIV